MSTETVKNPFSFTANLMTHGLENIAFDFLNEFFDLHKDIDIESNCADCKIDYHLEIEARSWGVKSISVIIDKVTASFYFEVQKFEIEKHEHLFKGWWKEDRQTYNLEFELSSYKPCNTARRMQESEHFNWKIECSVHPNTDGQISIEGVEWAWKEKIIYIN
jgi:hypothetical protein